MEAVLVALDNAHKDSQLENLTPDVNTALQLAVTNCQKASEKFRMKLTRWTKHSDGKIHWWDRVRVGLFAEATIKALSEQLNRCKSTINAAVSTATLYVFSSVRVYDLIIEYGRLTNSIGFLPRRSLLPLM